MAFVTPFSARYIGNFPIYYFPLSLKKLNNFLTYEIIAKDKVFYNLGDFLRDLFTKFFNVFFQKCKNEAFGQNDGTGPSIDFVYGDEKVRRTNTTNHGNLFIYGMKNSVNEYDHSNFGKYRYNLRRNRYHFYVGGQDRGILQSIKLQDIADPGLQAAIFFKNYPGAAADNTTGDSEDPAIGGWVPAIFTADITTLGCPLFNLGQEVYVDAKHFVPVTAKTLRQWKVNGYYSIKKITHKVTTHKFTSSIYTVLNVPDSLKEGIPREAAEEGSILRETGIEVRTEQFQTGTGQEPESIEPENVVIAPPTRLTPAVRTIDIDGIQVPVSSHPLDPTTDTDHTIRRFDLDNPDDVREGLYMAIPDAVVTSVNTSQGLDTEDVGTTTTTDDYDDHLPPVSPLPWKNQPF